MLPDPAARRIDVKRAVILAAGMGTRLGLGPGSEDRRPKPLVELGGRPLLVWVVEALVRAGIRHVTIVVGWHGEAIAAFLAGHPIAGADIDLVWNDAWRKKNGVSLLTARSAVREPFVLLMSDHIFEDRLLLGLISAPLAEGDVVLAVDRGVEQVFDIDDATKVHTDGAVHGRQIGKQLGDYDAVDCGLFLCQPAVFDALGAAAASSPDGDCSLSDAMQRLADDGHLRVHDIEGAFWQDVDTPEMFTYAEENLDKLA